MRAVQMAQFGGPEVLEEVELPDPVAGQDTVVLDVVAAEVLFLDTQLRSGWGREYFPVHLPFVPGAGVAGTIRSVGDGVDPGLVGRGVVAATGPTGTYRGGGYAEQAMAPLDVVFDLPSEVPFAEGLAALHDGLTALALLDRAQVQPGQTVLVTAAAGSLGSWLIPLLTQAGAMVVGAARGDRKLTHVRELGAAAVIDYSLDGWTDRVRETTDGVDLVFDGAGGPTGAAAASLVTAGGRFLAFGAASGGFADLDKASMEERGIAVDGILRPGPSEARRFAEQALAVLAARTIRPLIGQAFALADARGAHAAIEARTTLGKTVLTP